MADFLASLTITDVDTAPATGLAVTGVDNAHGVWQFSTDGGASWIRLGSPSDDGGAVAG